jgi:WD40 repeat protein
MVLVTCPNVAPLHIKVQGLNFGITVFSHGFVTQSQILWLQIWETGTGKLKLTLTGHIEQVRGLSMGLLLTELILFALSDIWVFAWMWVFGLTWWLYFWIFWIFGACHNYFFIFRMDIERTWVVDGTGLAVSPRHPYMFSAGDDKQVKCWDLEYNKVLFPLQIFTFT